MREEADVKLFSHYEESFFSLYVLTEVKLKGGSKK
jgi:hypothetical protein